MALVECCWRPVLGDSPIVLLVAYGLAMDRGEHWSLDPGDVDWSSAVETASVLDQSRQAGGSPQIDGSRHLMETWGSERWETARRRFPGRDCVLDFGNYLRFDSTTSACDQCPWKRTGDDASWSRTKYGLVNPLFRRSGSDVSSYQCSLLRDFRCSRCILRILPETWARAKTGTA